MLKILIIGYGFAGRSLHHHCISKMRDMGWSNVINPGVVAIDNAQPRAKIEYENVLFQTALQPISKEDSAYCVLHVCSPPSSHFENIKTALNCGYRQIIVEKPAVSTREQLLQLKALERFYGAKILVVANWVSSAAVTKAKELLDSEAFGRLSHITVVQNKSRFMRSRQRCGEHVFDIEMPHQVALALYLGGAAVVESAQVSDMIMPDMVIPNLGKGDLTLRHDNGITSQLHSSLIHTSRERYLNVLTSTGHRIEVAFPSGGDDSYSRLTIVTPTGTLYSDQLIEDDPLTLCFIRAYQYFIASQQNFSVIRPAGMDLGFNEQKVEILEAAKNISVRSGTQVNCHPMTEMSLKETA
ncbi:Gfo/Idh/MocA family protein [Reinekea forsetii]|jgi:predicted dehydrogenase|uniref:NAD(P)-binding protein oxidoreductase n=1 Tax=Reinekea forsetii TaxID=1336806 RepID=A0A2K8KQN7_9GAMM|nr:Gfo/Idh/MocA family oxidoreductase [Reinekea forsetii]ATX77058.1 NAD(P)-binding protein oxidoreductase [Reinekea forsetii]